MALIENILGDEVLARAAARLAPGKTVALSGVWGSSAPLAAAAIGRLKGLPVLFVAGHLDQADEIADDIEVLTGSPAHLLPAWEVDLGAEHLNDEIAGERLRLCNLLSKPPESREEPVNFIVAPVMSLLQPVPRPDVLATGRYALRTGSRVDLDEFAGWLVDAGFEQVEQVDQQGDFARRGGIMDIFPPGAATAVRVEFFGDQIESIRRVDLDTQRSIDAIDAYDIAAVKGQWAQDLASTANFLDYLPDGAIVCMFEPQAVMALAGEIYRRATEQSTAGPAEADEVEIDEDLAVFARPMSGQSLMTFQAPEKVFSAITRLSSLELTTFTPAARTGTLDLGVASLAKLSLNTQESLSELLELVRVADVWVFCENAAEEKRFREVLAQMKLPSIGASRVPGSDAVSDAGILPACAEGVPPSSSVSSSSASSLEQQQHKQRQDTGKMPAALEGVPPSSLHYQLRTAIGHVHAGFYWPGRKLVVVGHHEIFHRYSHMRRMSRVRAGRPIESLLDLRDGDFVVHVGHGIAKFEGLRTLEQDGPGEEYLRLRFADNAILNVPASRINLVQKYIGTGGKKPSLSKLGGGSWTKQKERAAESVQDLAAELLRVQAARQASNGVSYPVTSEWQNQFTDEFVYTETEDQLAAMRQLDQDMVEARPMDRLLCGDVGYGKTELAMRAAFKVAEAGKQVAVLVPTTVLADQHFRTFTERMADYPFRVEVLSRFRSPKQQSQVIRQLAAGQVDILIGTHRILSKDVKFPDLGMVVIDEEQRFGVKHKEHLKGLRSSVDVLTMTATPIPRTLHMALLGLRDISSLATPPMDRRAIHTQVCHYDDGMVRSVIMRELNRGGQVFFVHNRVTDIDSLAKRIKDLVPDARIAVGHGQMSEGKLETVMLKFVRGLVDVLVCTTIIESGLDIPSANTIVIHNADRFGLAELHQLRGRVGRGKHRAYCYLLLPEHRGLTSIASRRLKAIEEFSDLGAGFQIAMRDLEIRGAGNILGKEQSGHIAVVGYELYCQLLDEAVRQLKGLPAPRRVDTHLEIGVDAIIPPAYVPSDRQRMEIYRRLAGCSEVGELVQLRQDLADAYGRMPPIVGTLLDLAEIRVLAAGAGIVSIIRMDPDIIFATREMKLAKRALEKLPGTVRQADEQTLHWRPPKNCMQMPTLANVLLKRLQQR